MKVHDWAKLRRDFEFASSCLQGIVLHRYGKEALVISDGGELLICYYDTIKIFTHTQCEVIWIETVTDVLLKLVYR